MNVNSTWLIFMGNPRFLVTCQSSSIYRRVTPSLPQWGKHPKGCTPLTPISEVLVNLLRLSLYGGCPSGGGGSTECVSPQERLLSSPQGFLQSTFIRFPFRIFNKHSTRIVKEKPKRSQGCPSLRTGMSFFLFPVLIFPHRN
jgi:hypothetical protein